MNLRPILAIARLTWKAAVRFRLFVVVTGLLLAVVVLLPMLITDLFAVRTLRRVLANAGAIRPRAKREGAKSLEGAGLEPIFK